MQARFASASAAFPGVRVSEAAFAGAWAARAPTSEARSGDVLLAVGIEAGDPEALRWLTLCVRHGLQALQRAPPPHPRDDVESRVLELIAVGGPNRAPRIRTWAALGPLAGWVHVVVARTAAQLAHQQHRTEAGDFEVLMLGELEQAGPPGQELEALRGRLRPHLGPALHVAIAKLPPRDRALLSLHYLRGVGLEELGRAWQVHRATVSRWLVAARQAFLEGTRDELAARAQIDRLEVDSLVRALQSQLEPSLKRLLDESDG